MGRVHDMVTDVCKIYFERMRRYVYVTPKSYLSFIDFYLSVYKTKYVELNAEEKNIRLGLEILHEAAQGIVVLKEDLTKEEVKLGEAVKRLINFSKNLKLRTKKFRRKLMSSEKSNKNVKNKQKRLQSRKQMLRRILLRLCLTSRNHLRL